MKKINNLNKPLEEPVSANVAEVERILASVFVGLGSKAAMAVAPSGIRLFFISSEIAAVKKGTPTNVPAIIHESIVYSLVQYTIVLCNFYQHYIKISYTYPT